MTIVNDKLEKLKDQFLDDGSDTAKADIANWERELVKLQLITDLAKTDAIKMLVDQWIDKIVQINGILVNQKDLKSRERAILMLEKEIRMDFISIFRDAESTIKEIEKQIDINL